VVTPIVAGQLKSTDAPEGTSLTLECFLNGTPYPTVTWYKDGVAITEGPDYVITVGNNNGEPCTLRIRRLNPAVHSGVYSVKAVNPGGEATSLATVNVICEWQSVWRLSMHSILDVVYFNWQTQSLAVQTLHLSRTSLQLSQLLIGLTVDTPSLFTLFTDLISIHLSQFSICLTSLYLLC